MKNNQRKIYLDTAQLHEAYMDAALKRRTYLGGMSWKKAKGKEYLFRSSDRYGHGKSLGLRSPKTESTYLEFHQNKKEIFNRIHRLKDRLKEQARFCKAARISRVPRIVTAVLRVLEQHQLLGSNLQVVGTNALYAYEASAGVFLEPGLLATQDLDLLWDNRSKLHLFAFGDVDKKRLIDVLLEADKSFTKLGKSTFTAVNRDGYMIDLIKPEPNSPLRKENRQMGSAEDLAAAEIKNLQWLVSAPKFSQIIIGDDGYPARIVVPDPRAFAIHKLWLSTQTDRDPVKKNRDRTQSFTVYNLVLRYLTELKFNSDELRMFPKDITEEALRAFDGIKMPPGY
jgi:hypothetical protein